MKMLIIGGAGFIGINSADYFLNKGHDIVILDNFSRAGTESNVSWLKETHPDKKIKIVKADIRYDQDKMDTEAADADVIIHLAAQVAVTTSVKNPKEDFEINALGTLNVLEAARKSKSKPIVLYSSTNKVYGGMENVEVVERNGRYEYKDFRSGVPETQQLDFHSPYGCSKGTGDQYVRDYARIYGLRTVVFRQSCIYGKRQFGVEDQGWLAWFTIASLLKKPLSIYGDGKQIRDVLYVGDLIEAYEIAIKNIDRCSGKVYNMGGGPKNTMSLLELVSMLDTHLDEKVKHGWGDWRPGDQKVFVADTTLFEKETGWKAKTSPEKGVKIMIDWIKKNKELFKK
ncbi:CDP-paratose 2-epimerase [Candidatus Woesearchaeota archaeon CG11_big_fil_rev_8_21_14_0_20_43_8]|nr:MAG: CDP-paratose 2-epimerase [Candidatus Woesearchaeota archaeon CG11_big_fil_rev_8_21_14_0_20_43_8]